jgi:hypothetical protein
MKCIEEPSSAHPFKRKKDGRELVNVYSVYSFATE